jgi:hypothetical protein
MPFIERTGKTKAILYFSGYRVTQDLRSSCIASTPQVV